jgi:hypothetical protein
VFYLFWSCFNCVAVKLLSLRCSRVQANFKSGDGSTGEI